MQMPKNTNVLFLEDDADTRKLVAYTLKQAGINVISAETVAEAWQAALAFDIDLFLLDGLIPNGDSLKLCSDLRMIEPIKPIVFYSGLAYRDDILKGLSAGATAYLVKPFTGDLAKELFRFIRRESSTNELEPLFLNKESVMEAFEMGVDSATDESVRIIEVPAGFRATNWTEAFVAPPELIPVKLRSTRTMRAARGIF